MDVQRIYLKQEINFAMLHLFHVKLYHEIPR